MIPLKSFNWFEVAIGRPGSGKSYGMRQRAWSEARRVGAYLIVHDPTWSWSEAAGRVPHVRHVNGHSLARGLAQHGGRVAHVIDVPDADQALQIALQVARQSMAAAAKRKSQNASPVILIADEVVSAGGLDPHGLSPLWRDVIARRRHYHVGIGITAQSTFFGHRSITALATGVEVYALTDEADIKRLMQMGVPPDVAAKLRQMPNRVSVRLENGQVVRAPFENANGNHAQIDATDHSRNMEGGTRTFQERSNDLQERNSLDGSRLGADSPAVVPPRSGPARRP